MTSEQVRLVRQSFARVLPKPDEVASLFYACLFDLNPPLAELISGDLQAQSRKLMLMLTFAIKGLDQLDKLEPALRSLGAKCADYGIDEHDHRTVRTAFLWSLERSLGTASTPEINGAWSAVYDVMTERMRAGTRNCEVLAAA
ncbi:MAG TPA: globin domain-containing protein [Pyrinomonadaceae bacterium]|nr:globin domain-containing protein [Pyrinomonadaceae bacterium]